MRVIRLQRKQDSGQVTDVLGETSLLVHSADHLPQTDLGTGPISSHSLQVEGTATALVSNGESWLPEFLALEAHAFFHGEG